MVDRNGQKYQPICGVTLNIGPEDKAVYYNNLACIWIYRGVCDRSVVSHWLNIAVSTGNSTACNNYRHWQSSAFQTKSDSAGFRSHLLRIPNWKKKKFELIYETTSAIGKEDEAAHHNNCACFAAMQMRNNPLHTDWDILVLDEFKIAAELGNVVACKNYAQCLLEGIKVGRKDSTLNARELCDTLARQLADKGDWNGAAELYDLSSQLGSWKERYNCATCLLNAGNYTKARIHFKCIIRRLHRRQKIKKLTERQKKIETCAREGLKRCEQELKPIQPQTVQERRKKKCRAQELKLIQPQTVQVQERRKKKPVGKGKRRDSRACAQGEEEVVAVVV